MPTTAHEKYATLFDVYRPPVGEGSAAFAGTRALNGFGASSQSVALGGGGLEFATAQPVFGFGNASIRFNNVEYPWQSHGLVNKQVIMLEDGGSMPVTGPMPPGALSNTLPAYAARFATEDGRSFGRTPGFGPSDPSKAYILPKPHFVNGRLTEPDVVEVSVPRGAAATARTMHDVPVGVITPAERREALTFEKSQMRARLAHRAEKSENVRRAVLARSAYPRGIAGVEGPGMADSAVYSTQTAHQEALAEAGASFHAARAMRLGQVGNSQVGHPLLEHSEGANGAVERLFQTKGRAQHSQDSWGGRGESYVYAPAGRLHPLRQPSNNEEKPLRAHDAERAQAIYNAREGGRNFDIITGVVKPIACTVPERIDMRGAHESHFAAANAAATSWGGGLGRYAKS